MGSLAKPTQYWIKKRGSQSGSKKIVSLNFAFSLPVSLFYLYDELRFFSLPVAVYGMGGYFFSGFLLDRGRFRCDKEQAIAGYFHASAFYLFAFETISLPVFTSGASSSFFSRMEGKESGKTAVPFPNSCPQTTDLKHISAFRFIRSIQKKKNNQCNMGGVYGVFVMSAE